MRILQIVTYISPDGAYGGPVRVAINQAKALTELGHEVIIAAAAGGFTGPLPQKFDDFPVTLFRSFCVLPKTGFAGLTSPGLLTWLRTAIKSADVIHVHLARDLVTLPAAALTLLMKKPLVVQTHGMIDRTDKVLARPLDIVLTKPVLRSANAILYLTDREKCDLLNVGGVELPLRRLENAVAVPLNPAIEQTNGVSEEIEVLYLARLHPRKRPEFVVNSAKNLSKIYDGVRFTLIGPDEGAAESVKKCIEVNHLQSIVQWKGAIPPECSIERMQSASIYALPSVDEPFPMSVLEAMSLGLPVIVTSSCGLAPIIQKWHAGIVCGNSQASFDEALQRLIEDSEQRIEMGANGRKAIQQKYALSSLGKNLFYEYCTIITKEE